MEEKPLQTDHTPPPTLSRWETFKIFLWNPDKGQVLGRTGLSWAKIILFYVFFYASLVLFYFALWMVFYHTIDQDSPKWKLEESVIGSNPGLSFRPSQQWTFTDIKYDVYDKGSWKAWTDEIDEFLKELGGEERNTCSTSATSKDPTQACPFDSAALGDCSKIKDYSYPSGSPCIFLKLNKIFGWEPEYYNSSKDLPDKMPQSLKNHITKLQESNPTKLNTAWVSCGEKDSDSKKLQDVEYFPERGFPKLYFPYSNQKNYTRPIVAVKLIEPEKNTRLHIECKVWAKNIKYDKRDNRGFIQFHLQVS